MGRRLKGFQKIWKSRVPYPVVCCKLKLPNIGMQCFVLEKLVKTKTSNFSSFPLCQCVLLFPFFSFLYYFTQFVFFKPFFNVGCCAFRPANGCSTRRSLVEINFLMFKQLFTSFSIIKYVK